MNKLIIILLSSICLSGFAQDPVDFSKLDSEKVISDPSVKWQQFGPGGSGNNYYIYWHPTDPDVVFQGPNMGNSYRSIDRGNTYEGILDPDGPGYKSQNRGPIGIYSPEFSHQDPSFGICTIEEASYVYFTRDKGRNWIREDGISKQFNNIHINTIKVDPTDDNIWYAGSGNVRDCNHFFFIDESPHGVYGDQWTVGTPEDGGSTDYGHSAKIWKSTDKGQSWKEITPQDINSKTQITRIFVHPGKHNTIFAATTYGFYKSIDGGNNWVLKTNTGLDNDIIRSMDMHFDPNTNKVTLFAIDLVKYIPNGNTVTYNGGIFKSIDEGESWVNINSNMPLEQALIKSDDIKNSFYKRALARWFMKTEAEVQELYPELPQKLLHSISMIRVNPRNVNNILVVNNYKSQFTFVGGMLWRTDDGGKDWFVTLRNGTAWEGKDKALWDARNNPTRKNLNCVGQREWEGRDPYDRKAGACVEFNCDGSTIMFQVAKVVCVSNDNGDNWLENDEKETEPGNGHLVGAGNSNMPGMEIIQDERIKSTVYFCSGENSIWKTTNDGYKVRPGALAVYKISLPNKQSPEECSVGSLVIDPNDTNTFYSLQFRQAFFGKLMKSTDGGQNWTEHGILFDPREYGNPGIMKIHQNNLLIDPAYRSRFYCTVTKKLVNDVVNSRPEKFDAFGIYRSIDGGVTFHTINEGLPLNGDVQKLALNPQFKGVVWAAVSGNKYKPGGLFRLENGSSVWEKVTIPNGMVSVHDIYFSQDNRMYISGGTLDGKNSEGGVWFKEEGKGWEQVFPYKFANHIRVAKYDENLLLVDVPSMKDPDILNPGVYRSLDKGKTWYKINAGNIQSDRLNALEIDYNKKGVYYCSTYGAGYYVCEDARVVLSETFHTEPED